MKNAELRILEKCFMSAGICKWRSAPYENRTLNMATNKEIESNLHIKKRRPLFSKGGAPQFFILHS